MKSIRGTLLTLMSIALLIACKKEKSFESGGTNTLNTEWEFKENKVYKGKVDTAFLDDFGTSINTLFLTGTSSDGQELLAIQVIGLNSSAPGTYRSPNVLFTYLNSRTSLYESDLSAAGDFTLVVTKIDSVSISATFTGKVKDSSGASKTVTEGKFTAKLKNNVVNPPPVGSGGVVFWAKAGCTGANPAILVKVNNTQTGTITSFVPTAPTACGGSGNASFILPPGTYAWTAYCGSTDSTSGSVTIVANQCVSQEVSFVPQPPTNCKISDIGFYDLATNVPVAGIHAVYNAGGQVTNVQLIDSLSNQVINNFVLTYSAGKIQIDNNQSFNLDGSGRVTEFRGFFDPTDNTSDKVIIKYTYDANGYMNKYTFEYADTPGVIRWQGIFEYTGGNLTKITENDPALPAAGKIETLYEYHTNVAKNFLYFIPSFEIIYFQSAINAGKSSQNAIKKETVKYTDGAGNVQTQVTNYDTYVIDSGTNPYVRSFKITGDGNYYFTDVRIGLKYKCP